GQPAHGGRLRTDRQRSGLELLDDGRLRRMVSERRRRGRAGRFAVPAAESLQPGTRRSGDALSAPPRRHGLAAREGPGLRPHLPRPGRAGLQDDELDGGTDHSGQLPAPHPDAEDQPPQLRVPGMSMNPQSLASKRKNERGAALVVAILVLAILTVIGIALMLITSTETRIAANEWSVNRGFYSADAGVRWASAQLSPWFQGFMTRPEFGTRAAPIWTGSVLFNMDSHRFVTGTGFFGTNDIQVRVATPGRLSRRCAVGFPCNAGGNG